MFNLPLKPVKLLIEFLDVMVPPFLYLVTLIFVLSLLCPLSSLLSLLPSVLC
jgi:hypothetical protein